MAKIKIDAIKKYDNKGVEISIHLRNPIVLLLIENTRKTANMVKALAKIGLKIDADQSKGFEISKIKK